ncbi:MAG: glycoside hydrolase TIM-barrel-like domain-containing protein [Candidatus Omnitrophota bacterium]
MCYVTWYKDRFSSQYSDQSLEKLADLGTEYISIVVTQYQDTFNSTVIKPTENTPSDRSITHVIKKARGLGMKIMLKPHIDLLDTSRETYWRGDIGFANEDGWNKWFSQYQSFILHYAHLAKQLNVDIFCVGSELSFTTQKDSRWRDQIISEVRKVYPGKLIYAANWDNYKNIKFWKHLDYVGIDAYFPLTRRKNPSVTELKRGWEKWKSEIRAFQTTVNKPIIFTEIGYPSSSYAPESPWQYKLSGNADPELQARCYKAFFDTMWGCSWLEGVYWWNWSTNVHAGGKYNRQFTPQNKPAEKILEAYYKGYKKDSTFALAD